LNLSLRNLSVLSDSAVFLCQEMSPQRTLRLQRFETDPLPILEIITQIIDFISPINLSLFTILRRMILIDSSGKPDSSVTV